MPSMLNGMYSNLPIYRACRGKEKTLLMSGCTVNWYLENNTVHSKYRDKVNRNTVNQEMTVLHYKSA